MRRRALAGKQVAQHGLAEKLMPECVAISVTDQHVAGYRRAQRGRQRGVIEPGRRDKQRMPDPVSAHGDDPQHLFRFTG